MNQVLKNIRRIHGITLAELAERMGHQKSYLSKIETGMQKPTRELLIKYSEVFHLRLSFLEFFGRESAPRNWEDVDRFEQDKQIFENLISQIEKRKNKKRSINLD